MWPVYDECPNCGESRSWNGAPVTNGHVTACRRKSRTSDRALTIRLRALRVVAAHEAARQVAHAEEFAKAVLLCENAIAGATYAVRRDMRRFIKGEHDAFVFGSARTRRALYNLNAQLVPRAVDWYALICAAISSVLAICTVSRNDVRRAVRTKCVEIGALKLYDDFERSVVAARYLWVNGK
jgi:hypothetical protein